MTLLGKCFNLIFTEATKLISDAVINSHCGCQFMAEDEWKNFRAVPDSGYMDSHELSAENFCRPKFPQRRPLCVLKAPQLQM